jgi:hypothetical protein
MDTPLGFGSLKILHETIRAAVCEQLEAAIVNPEPDGVCACTTDRLITTTLQRIVLTSIACNL